MSERLQRSRTPSNTQLVWLGIAVALLNLARTDTLIFTALAGAFILFRYGMRSAVAFTIPLVALVGPYLCSNYLLFGEVMPMSGAVKRTYSMHVLGNEVAAIGQSAWRILLINLGWAWHPDFMPITYSVLLSALGIFYCGWRKEFPLALFCGFIVLKYIVYATAYFHHSAYLWYYAPDFVAALLVLMSMAMDIVRWGIVAPLAKIAPKWVGAGLGFALMVLVAGYCGTTGYQWQIQERDCWRHFKTTYNPKIFPSNEVDLFYLAATNMRRHKPAQDLVYGMHNSGIFSYFSSLTIVNFDGLVNSKTRLDYIKKYGYGFAEYMDETQRIDAYLDFISYPAKPSYDDTFLKRGFVEIPLHELLEHKYGAAAYTNEGGKLVMYARTEVADRMLAARSVEPHMTSTGTGSASIK